MAVKQRTLKEWNARGRWVKKGSKAVGFTVDGDAMFTKDQTRKRKHRYDDGRYGNYNNDHYYFGGDNPDPMDYDLGLCGQS